MQKLQKWGKNKRFLSFFPNTGWHKNWWSRTLENWWKLISRYKEVKEIGKIKKIVLFASIFLINVKYFYMYKFFRVLDQHFCVDQCLGISSKMPFLPHFSLILQQNYAKTWKSRFWPAFGVLGTWKAGENIQHINDLLLQSLGMIWVKSHSVSVNVEACLPIAKLSFAISFKDKNGETLELLGTDLQHELETWTTCKQDIY